MMAWVLELYHGGEWHLNLCVNYTPDNAPYFHELYQRQRARYGTAPLRIKAYVRHEVS